MSAWRVLQGNTSIQDITVKDKDGALVTNLADAESIIFQVKEKRSDETPKITKTKDDGIEVLADGDLGKLRITLNPADTEEMKPVRYLMALQIKWSATLIYEIILSFDGEPTVWFQVCQDII